MNFVSEKLKHLDGPEPGQQDDKLHEECGVFGIWAPGHDVARMTYFALHALQHRGQDSSGIAVGDGKTVLVRKDLGLVTQVFTDADLAAMPGKVACGHCRYGTAGAKGWESAQPHLSMINDVIIALAHNGTLVNFDSLRHELIEMGVPFRSNTDSEVAAKLIGFFTQRGHSLRTGIAHTMRMLEGGYAMVLVRDNALYAFRDPHGIRPLVLGKLPGDAGWVVASETCALDTVGAEYVREVASGEIIRISDDGFSSQQGCRPRSQANCIFEHVYFSRPDSVKLNALSDVVAGKRLVMVDDSIVRGTTSNQIVQLLRDAGATEVHVRSASPMVKWPCFYGIDTADQDQLIAANMTLEQIREHIGADSVGFLSIEGLMECVPKVGYCRACFDGNYPVEIPKSFYEEKFLPGYKPNNLEAASDLSKMHPEDVLEMADKEN